MAIVPDAKDWTWVLQRPCPECGLDTQRFAREAVADMTRVNAAAWHDGAAFTIESFARYLIHDPVHHLYDVTQAQHAHPQDER